MRRGLVVTVLLGLLAAAGAPARGQDAGRLEDAEEQAMGDTVQQALEKNPSNQASEWVNPDTGRSGAVVPVRTFENDEGQPCREFVTTIVIGGKEEQGYGTACRQPDGSWRIVADDQDAPPGAPSSPSEAAPPPPPAAYSYPPPAAYYAYPPGFYGPSHILLSFSYVYRGGRAYRGRYYLRGNEFRRRHPFQIRERVFVGPRVYERFRWRDREEKRRPGEVRPRDDRRPPGWGDPDRRGRGQDRRGRRREQNRDRR